MKVYYLFVFAFVVACSNVNAQPISVELMIQDVQIDGSAGSFVIHGKPSLTEDMEEYRIGAYQFDILFDSFQGLDEIELNFTNLVSGMIDAGERFGSGPFPQRIATGEVFQVVGFGVGFLTIEGTDLARIDFALNDSIESGESFLASIIPFDPIDQVFRRTIVGDAELVLDSRQIGNGGPCDVNLSGVCDANDIDFLSDIVGSGEQDLQYDLNGDGAVNTDDRTFWIVELMNTYVGDSDLDGVFGTGDLIAVFSAGEYEDEAIGNSSWATGDWNGDRDFGTPDLIAAFGQAGFEAGPRAAAANVPEPLPMPPLLLGLVASLRIARRNRNV